MEFVTGLLDYGIGILSSNTTEDAKQKQQQQERIKKEEEERRLALKKEVSSIEQEKKISYRENVWNLRTRETSYGYGGGYGGYGYGYGQDGMFLNYNVFVNKKTSSIVIHKIKRRKFNS